MNALFAVAMGACGVTLGLAYYGLRKAQKDLALEEAERVLQAEWDACEPDRQSPVVGATKEE